MAVLLIISKTKTEIDRIFTTKEAVEITKRYVNNN